MLLLPAHMLPLTAHCSLLIAHMLGSLGVAPKTNSKPHMFRRNWNACSICNHSRLVNIVRGLVWSYLMNVNIFSLIMNKIFIQPYEESDYKLNLHLLTILYKICVLHILGVIKGKSNYIYYIRPIYLNPEEAQILPPLSFLPPSCVRIGPSLSFIIDDELDCYGDTYHHRWYLAHSGWCLH